MCGRAATSPMGGRLRSQLRTFPPRSRSTKIEQPDSGPGGIYARLEEAGHTLARFSEEVGARMPTPEERRALLLSAGTPVLTVVRTAYDKKDVAVEVCDTVKVASAYLLEYDFPAR